MKQPVEVRFQPPLTWSQPYAESERMCIHYQWMRYAYMAAMQVHEPFHIENCMCRSVLQP